MLSKLNPLEWIAIAFVTFIFGYMGYNHFLGKENDELKVNNAIQAGVIQVQTKAITVAENIAEVKQEINLQVHYDKIGVEKKHKQIAEKAQQKEADIQIKFLEKPITVETVIERSNEISAVRIDALWEAYCSDNEDPIGCVATALDIEGNSNA